MGKQSTRVFVAAEVCSFSKKILWTEVPELNPYVKIRFFQKGTLFLAVANSTVAAEIKLAEIELLKRIQKRFPEVQKIRYRFENFPPQISPKPKSQS